MSNSKRSNVHCPTCHQILGKWTAEGQFLHRRRSRGKVTEVRVNSGVVSCVDCGVQVPIGGRVVRGRLTVVVGE